MTNYDILKEYESHNTPVPSYEEWLALQSDSLAKNEGEEIIAELENRMNLERQLSKSVLEENAKLKEMLYKCREKLDELDYGCEVWQGELTGFIEEIDEVLNKIVQLQREKRSN